MSLRESLFFKSGRGFPSQTLNNNHSNRSLSSPADSFKQPKRPGVTEASLLTPRANHVISQHTPTNQAVVSRKRFNPLLSEDVLASPRTSDFGKISSESIPTVQTKPSSTYPSPLPSFSSFPSSRTPNVGATTVPRTPIFPKKSAYPELSQSVPDTKYRPTPVAAQPASLHTSSLAKDLASAKYNKPKPLPKARYSSSFAEDNAYTACTERSVYDYDVDDNKHEIPLSLSSGINGSKTKAMSFLQRLSQEQSMATTAALDKPLMIVAAPGSGKTLTLTARIAYMILNGIQSNQILAITFTRKAAEEMRERVQQLLRCELTLDVADVTVLNFHQLALRVIRAHSSKLGFRGDVHVLSNREQRATIKRCLGVVLHGKSSHAISQLQSQLTDQHTDDADDDLADDAAAGFDNSESDQTGSNWNRSGYAEEDTAIPNKLVDYFTSFIRSVKQGTKSVSHFSDEHKSVIHVYEQMLKQQQAIDFSDMVAKTLSLWRTCPDVLRGYQRQFEYVLCDEFQDVNQSQFDLLQLLCEDSQKLTVCGDDDQSIYGWRGTSIRSFSLFERLFAHRSLVNLNQNFRSAASIVKATSAMIANNTLRQTKNIRTENASEHPIELLVASDAAREAELVAQEIKTRRKRMGLRYKDIAVLFRTRRVAREFESALKREGIPLVNTAKTTKNPYANRHVVNILAYCSLLCRDDDDQAFLRVLNVPKRGLGPSVVTAVKHICERQKRLSYMSAAKLCVVQEGVLKAKQKEQLNQFLNLITDLREAAASLSPVEIVKEILDRTQYFENLSDIGPQRRKRSDDATEQIDSKEAKRKARQRERTRDSTDRNNGHGNGRDNGRKKEEVEEDDEIERKEFLICLLQDLETFKVTVDRADEDEEADIRQTTEEHSDKVQSVGLGLQRTNSSVEGMESTQQRKVQEVGLKSLEGFLVLAKSGQLSRSSKSYVTLTTIHQAKGLEWSLVFVVRFNESIMPLAAKPSAPAATTPAAEMADESGVGSSVVSDQVEYLEEERRLAYVALSRAKDRLVISWCSRDAIGNHLLPSRFLEELPSDLTQVSELQKSRTDTNKQTVPTGRTVSSTSSSGGGVSWMQKAKASAQQRSDPTMIQPEMVDRPLDIVQPDRLSTHCEPSVASLNVGVEPCPDPFDEFALDDACLQMMELEELKMKENTWTNQVERELKPEPAPLAGFVTAKQLMQRQSTDAVGVKRTGESATSQFNQKKQRVDPLNSIHSVHGVS